MEESLEDDIHYYSKCDSMKALKRLFSLLRIEGEKKNKERLEKLVDFFNSEVGFLNKIKNELTILETLLTFPGIGPATAGALLAFAFDKPAVFIETNIRRVFIHFFFRGMHGVRDREILPLVQKTLDTDQPRAWYYALMDYGAMLKSTETNPNRRSAHYNRQSPFQNSDRQIRGLIIKTMIEQPVLLEQAILEAVGKESERVTLILNRLIDEGFLSRTGDQLSIAAAGTTENASPDGDD